MAISLVAWHLALNKISGAMVLKFHKAEPADLRGWAAALRHMANAMDVVAGKDEGDGNAGADEVEFP
jgi:hypothetical protein